MLVITSSQLIYISVIRSKYTTNIVLTTIMDLIHKIFNITLPFLSVILLIIVLPILLVYRIIKFCIRSAFPENLVGKVVIITGASSGIGEVKFNILR